MATAANLFFFPTTSPSGRAARPSRGRFNLTSRQIAAHAIAPDEGVPCAPSRPFRSRNAPERATEPGSKITTAGTRRSADSTLGSAHQTRDERRSWGAQNGTSGRSLKPLRRVELTRQIAAPAQLREPRPRRNQSAIYAIASRSSPNTGYQRSVPLTNPTDNLPPTGRQHSWNPRGRPLRSLRHPSCPTVTHRTMTTGQWARCATLYVTEPRSRSAILPRLRAPRTSMSACSRSAAATRPLAGSSSTT